VDFLARYAPQKIIRGAYIINIFFFATCGTKIRRIFYPPKSVIVLRHFGHEFFGVLTPPKKFMRGAYIINDFFFATCGTKIRRIFYPPKSVIVLRHFGVDFLGKTQRISQQVGIAYIFRNSLYLR
jgi:hypothetical protein